MARVAEEVLSYCSSCRLDLRATVVAMKGDQIIKVQCKTCRGERLYKAPKGVTDPSKAPPPKTRAGRTASGEKADHSVGTEWRNAMNSHRSRPLQTYSAKLQVSIGDRIAHPTFGEGVVLKHIHPNKAEIIFEMDIKTLICGGPKTG